MALLVVFLFALGLCFDTLAVSVSAGMGCCTWRGGRGVRFAVILGLSQALMPFLGWFLAAEFHSVISTWDHWIAFVLLAFLGGKMILSGIRNKGDNALDKDPFTLRNSTLMGVATSIDALIAGVTFALVGVDIVDASQIVNVLIAVGIIGVVTFLASITGLILGKHTRGHLGAKAEIIGGIILILIGTKVLFEHLNEPVMCRPIAVMSFNIRYDNPADGAHNWHNRKGAIVDMLHEQKPDVIGIQEGLSHQVAFLDSILTTYKYIGVGRDDGAQAGEFAAIFYNTIRLRAVNSGHFWLSDTVDRPAFGWDAVCVRIATWGLFEERGSGKQFFAVNTHFDHVGTVARRESGKLIINKIEAMDASLPLVLTGDFNCTIEDGTLNPILDKMNDGRPSDSEAVPYTFIGFDAGADFDGRAIIDHIFVRGMLTSNYRIITESYGAPAGQLSDHLPVILNLN